jgi:hypothetical protein
MTARHHIRIGNRRLGRDRTAIDATPAPRLSETLQLARERKGVDLYRAERDTKIRLKYLAALAWRQSPSYRARGVGCRCGCGDGQSFAGQDL